MFETLAGKQSIEESCKDRGYIDAKYTEQRKFQETEIPDGEACTENALYLERLGQECLCITSRRRKCLFQVRLC
jgi:hypothetical protein